MKSQSSYSVSTSQLGYSIWQCQEQMKAGEAKTYEGRTEKAC